MSAPHFVALVGPPGSGKTTWSGERYRREDQVSLDWIRGWLTGDVGNMKINGPAVKIMHEVLDQRMRHRVTTVLDNTNAIPGHRASAVTHARAWGIPSIAVVFTTTLARCLTNMAARGRRVDEAIVADMHARIAADLPPGTPAAGVDLTCWIDPIGAPGVVWTCGQVPDRLRDVPWLAGATPMRTNAHGADWRQVVVGAVVVVEVAPGDVRDLRVEQVDGARVSATHGLPGREEPFSFNFDRVTRVIPQREYLDHIAAACEDAPRLDATEGRS